MLKLQKEGGGEQREVGGARGGRKGEFMSRWEKDRKEEGVCLGAGLPLRAGTTDSGVRTG